MPVLAALLVVMLAPLAGAQQLVLDVNPFTDDPGSTPGPFVSFGPTVAFAATTAATGRELWLLADGASQAQLVADLAPGPADAAPEHVVSAGGLLFFAADDGSGPGLYASDGTGNGTRRLRSLRLAPERDGAQIFAVGGAVFAIADDGVGGPELWHSDGTVAGTRLVRELEPGAGGCALIAATAAGSELYFAVRTPHSAPVRTLLVRSDGSALGTTVITASDAGGPLVGAHMVAAGGAVFFAGSPASAPDYELWRTDGTAVGTQLLVDLDASGGSFLGPLLVFGSRVAFLAHADSYGAEPVVSDGTAFGTQIVDVNVLVGRGSTPAHLTVRGNDLFLFAIAPTGAGLFRIDGNQLTATFLRPLQWQASPRRDMVGSGARVFLRALEPSAQGRTTAQMWVSDGTPAGTVALRDLRQGLGDPRFDHLHAHGSGVVFAADDGLTGAEPWRSDGTPTGTGVAANVSANPRTRGLGSSPTFFLHTGNLSVFDADDGDRGREPFVTDGTAAGTQRLADLVVGPAGSTLAPLATVPRGVVFASTPSAATAPTDYWVSDGAAGGVVRLALPALLGPPHAGTVATDGDRAVVFAAPELTSSGGILGHLLLRTDGITVQALLPRFGAPPRDVHVVAGVPFFAAPGAGGGYEPWTPAGQVLDLNPGPAGSAPGAGLGVALSGAYVFAADDGSAGVELWRSDGTAAGTHRIADLAVGAASANPRRAVVAGARVFFVADVTGAGAELCVTDGSSSGTRLVADVRAGPLGSDPSDLVAQHDGVYFAADGGGLGRRLWFSDGTAAGTRPVGANAAANPRALHALGSRRVLFVAEDAVEGDEPWLTDGTAAATQRLSVQAGTAGSGVVGFEQRLDGRVLFVADDGVHGREPWLFEPGAIAVAIGASCGVGDTSLQASDPVLGGATAVSGRHGTVANLVGALVLSTPARGALLGCRLYVDPSQVVVPLLVTRGTFGLTLPLPNAPRLVGGIVHVQAALAPFAVPPGLSLSNGVALRLGR